MLKGFTLPRSPLGAAALASPPPWYFAGDVVAVEFWNDPEVSIYTLPTGIELDTKSAGHSVALFTDYQFTGQNEEYLDPARYQCRGFSVLLDATWKGLRVAWCPFSYVDNDAAIMRGWIQGYPKKLGSVYQTRTFGTANAASVPLANGSRFAACVSAHGQLLAQATVTLREKADHLAGLLDHSIAMRRHFPRLSAGMHNKPIVDEIVRCISDDVLITGIWIGDGELVFPEAHGEELEILGPVKVGRGFRFSFSYSITDIEILADLTIQRRSLTRQTCSRLPHEQTLWCRPIKAMDVDLDKIIGEEMEVVHGRRNAEGLYRSEIAVRSGDVNSAPALALLQ